MRQSRVHLLRSLVVLFALSLGARAYADDRAEARVHYQTGMKFYGAGDYRGAIREFSAAQQLAPADLNNYNLALCYDKLGDAEPAVQYYRAFLDKQPNSDKRAEIQASINRLESASRSAAGKKADEVRRAEDARKADEARTEARRAEEARKADEPSG
ncbi:MAG TPA: tetratricopeptide repeat protein, partial [Kofleriaceae bacterium]|nr:tetratricopeptide repeat protein [Kofleriaceae bacterium]